MFSELFIVWYVREYVDALLLEYYQKGVKPIILYILPVESEPWWELFPALHFSFLFVRKRLAYARISWHICTKHARRLDVWGEMGKLHGSVAIATICS